MLRSFADNAPDGYGARAGYNLALEYLIKEPPKQPLPKNLLVAPPWVINWIEELGGRFIDGAIVVTKQVGKTALALLTLIAGILSIPLRFAH